MSYQPSWFIICQNRSCRRSLVVYLIDIWRFNRFYNFPKGICPEFNLTAWLGFELAYCKVAVQLKGHCVSESPTKLYSIKTPRKIYLHLDNQNWNHIKIYGDELDLSLFHIHIFIVLSMPVAQSAAKSRLHRLPLCRGVRLHQRESWI